MVQPRQATDVEAIRSLTEPLIDDDDDTDPEQQPPVVETFRRGPRATRLDNPRLRQLKAAPTAASLAAAEPSWWTKPDANFAQEAERMRTSRVVVPSANKILCFPI